MIILTLKLKHYIFTYFFHFYIHGFGYGYFLYFRRKIFIISRGVAPRSGKNYMKSMVAAVVRGAGRSHANTAKNVRKWWCCKLLFYMKHVKTRSFWVSLRRENKPEKYVDIQYSTSSEAPAIFHEFVSPPFRVRNFEKQSFLHWLCWLLSYKEKWEVWWQEMQPLKLTFRFCFCHKRTKTFWDITR